MDRPRIKPKRGPERKIQDNLINFLKIRDWLVMETHGNMYQRGFPDLYCAHAQYKQRWIEVKVDGAYSFTPAQLEYFPKLTSCGVGIWILTAATEDEYKKLFSPPNWWQYLDAMK